MPFGAFFITGGIMENILSSISNVGFPVALSIFLLLRFENKIDELTRAITELVIKINEQQK